MPITLIELQEKLNKIMEQEDIDKTAAIVYADVISGSDPVYPPGTIIFECHDSDPRKPAHILSIYPTQINKLLN